MGANLQDEISKQLTKLKPVTVTASDGKINFSAGIMDELVSKL